MPDPPRPRGPTWTPEKDDHQLYRWRGRAAMPRALDFVQAATAADGRAYDGFYLALADAIGGELWTADQRLAHSARTAGVPWVRWIGEPG